MYKGKKIIAIIPARKGSKGIPNKNIREVGGKPLIAHTIIPAKASKYIDQVLISTDAQLISDTATHYGAICNGLRPESLANDTAIIYDVVKYELLKAKKMGQGYDILVLLQPTSPLRTTEMIDQAIEKFVDEDQSSAVGVCEVEEHPIFMRTMKEDGTLSKVLDVSSTIRRQELPDFYKVNGILYINKVHDILDHFVSFNDNDYPIIIERQYCIDIDTLEDLNKVQNIMEHRAAIKQ